MNFANSLLLCSFILFFISFASLFRCFLFSRVLCFCHFAFAFLFSLIFSSIPCEIVFVCLLVGSGVVDVLAASWIVPVNVVVTTVRGETRSLGKRVSERRNFSLRFC